ncbi:DUF1883 domain-containing protein [Escherichia coli]|uniref:DUF1883 domain-containing protein n=1 Tax=Escherichia coli TaxID=562 RepID=UPI000906F39D|nr:DUF1883 domain-containing protein [Escherichia coli]EFA4243827.1 DUF1883 domain-containing protein [Escherichia coli O36:H5]EEW0731781.1 DUF1883 domain-containing protein [Escherichia coli]EEW3194308.1 DUF1883 domain-containing protein [Escherichia coli]EEW8197261.1 DUF1883 domain-containing protein [Escherichia coli]EEW8447117.1 DUF1883 domain-containing protein [Escherichia coli]
MQFLHKRMYLNAGDTVVVDCSHQCNILLMTDTNFNNYRNARSFHHHGGGGFFQRLPAHLHVPHSGYWNITIDLGGGSAAIRHSISVIPA